MIRPQRDSNPGPLDQKSNALTTEPKSRLPDAVVRDWLYTQKLCMICFMQIFVTDVNILTLISVDEIKVKVWPNNYSKSACSGFVDCYAGKVLNDVFSL